VIWRQTQWSLCCKWLHHCQKLTVVFITATHCSPFTCPKVEASDENLDLWYNFAHVNAIRWYELHQWQSAAAHVTRQSSTASVHWHHGSSSEHCCISSIFYNYRIQTWPIKAVSFLAGWILRVHMQYATEIGSNCDF